MWGCRNDDIHEEERGFDGSLLIEFFNLIWLEIQNLRFNKMELLQSQAPVERELLGSSVIRTLEFGNWMFDLKIELNWIESLFFLIHDNRC